MKLLLLGLLLQVTLPDSVRIEPAEVYMEVGQTHAFTATAYDSAGAMDLPIHWYSSGVDIVRVSALGEVGE